MVTRSQTKKYALKVVTSKAVTSKAVTSKDVIITCSQNIYSKKPKPHQKLFIFMAENAPIAVVIRKEIVRMGKKVKKEYYQLIKWDMKTNEFTEGQWLMNKQLFINGCSISPNGQLFGWVYNQYWLASATYAGVSRIPYFTAELFSDTICGRWNSVQFDKDSHPIAGSFDFEQRSNLPITLSKNRPRPSGIQEQTFASKTGKSLYVVDQYKILCDGVEIYDASKNVFENICKKK